MFYLVWCCFALLYRYICTFKYVLPTVKGSFPGCFFDKNDYYKR